MYKTPNYSKTTLKVNQSLEGETIEQKIERVTTNKEPIKDGAPLIYTDRNEGVLAGYNIRTDRFEIAVEAMDKIQKSERAKRESKAKMEVVKDSSETTSVPASNGTNE
jgi:hypothetical protein